jgi:hypothetical protein
MPVLGSMVHPEAGVMSALKPNVASPCCAMERFTNRKTAATMAKNPYFLKSNLLSIFRLWP